jgi:hypothetical protein
VHVLNLRAVTQAASGRLDDAADTLRLAEAETARLTKQDEQEADDGLGGGEEMANALTSPVSVAAAMVEEREGDLSAGSFRFS